ncbi:MAG: HAD-IIIA family hydrolase [Clostridiales bacterium]|nr:HAD-IIIA family hydrolase [Clostridiales bacterium]
MNTNKIKMLAMDIDGTLTDGKIYTSVQGEIMKAFNVKDGYAIANILPKENILPVIITGRKSKIAAIRAAELNISEIHQGVPDKLSLLKRTAEKYNIEQQEIAYIGDDLNDIDCMIFCGLAACPSDASDQTKKCADYICKLSGGEGAVREFIDFIIKTKK